MHGVEPGFAACREGSSARALATAPAAAAQLAAWRDGMTVWSAVSLGWPSISAAAEQSHEARRPYPGNKARCLLLHGMLMPWESCAV